MTGDSPPDGRDRRNRRSLLRSAAAAVTVGAVGGCVGQVSQSDESTASPDDAESPGQTGSPDGTEPSETPGAPQSFPRPMTVDASPALEPHPGADNPVVTAGDVTDREDVHYVADPFVAVADGTYHLFFEVAYRAEDASPDLALASSDDGLDWTYEGIVLDEPEHLAYPAVFRVDGTWYMTPDKSTYDYGGVPEFRLYRADAFPTDWTLVERPIDGEHVGDPTLFRRGDTWYLLSVEQDSVHGTRLHYAPSLVGADWTEHPASPVTTDPRQFRPAGRPLIDGDDLYLFFQDVERTYGDKVRCFEVTALSEREYDHREVDASPLLAATFDGGWRDQGMHHVDPALPYRGDANVVPVDGKDADHEWSIGVYRVTGREDP